MTFVGLSFVAGVPSYAQQNGSEDYPLLSQGDFTPPPPPPGYSVALPAMEPMVPPPPPPSAADINTPYNPQAAEPVTAPTAPVAEPAAPVATENAAPETPVIATPPTPPVLPDSPVNSPVSTPFAGPVAPPASPAASPEVPEAAKFNQQFVTAAPTTAPRTMQLITADLANQIKRLLRSLKTMRTVIDKPESCDELRRIQLTGRICADLLDLRGFPVPSRFVSSGNDRVIRDRSHDAVEYRFYGDFDNRLNGWIKPIETAVYVDLVFDGRSRRRTHVRARITRTGTLTGSFYAYSWDAYGNAWKMQGSMDNVFVHDDGLPAGGDLKVFGADPAGKTIGLVLNFPVKIHGEPTPEKADTRHREGQRVSIGN